MLELFLYAIAILLGVVVVGAIGVLGLCWLIAREQRRIFSEWERNNDGR